MKKTGFLTIAFLHFLLFLIIGTRGTAQKTTVSVMVSNAKQPNVVVEVNPVTLQERSRVPFQRTIKLNEKNQGSVDLELEGPSEIKLMMIWTDSSIRYMLSPGIDFTIRLDANRRDFVEIDGVGGEENKFHHFIMKLSENKLRAIPQTDPVSYMKQWRSALDSITQLTNNATAAGLHAAYTNWDLKNISSVFQTALMQQFVTYVTVSGEWPRNMQDYMAASVRLTDEQLNTPAEFRAVGDKDLVNNYYLFEVAMDYYKQDKNMVPALEAVYTAALEKTVKLKSGRIKESMFDHLIVSGITQANDTGFLKILPSYFSGLRKQEYYSLLKNTRDTLLRKTGAGLQELLFTATDLEGKPFSYANYAGSYLYIDIWATWCLPCIAEFPYIDQLKKEYAGLPVKFVSVAVDKKEEPWRAFLEKRKLHEGHFYSNPALESSISKIFMAKYIPAFVLIGPDGKVVRAACYRPSNPAMRMLLDRLLR